MATDEQRAFFTNLANKPVAPQISAEGLESDPWFAFNTDRSSVWSAAYRQFNLGSAISRTINDAIFDPEEVEGYDPVTDPQLADHEGIMYRFLSSTSPGMTRRKLKQYKADMEDLSLLAISDSGGAEFVNMVADPTLLLPLAPAKVLATASRWGRFVKGGAFTAATLAPFELLKQAELEGHTMGHTAVALTGATLIGGGLTAALGGRQIPAALNHSQKQNYKSAGASVSPEKARETAYATMEADGLAATGIGIEKLGWNPVIRMMASPNPFVRSLGASMVDMGGMMQKKVFSETAMDQSVEATFRTRYLGSLVDSIREADQAYLSYRGIVAKEGDVPRSMQMLGLAAKDTFKRGRTWMNEVEFRTRVGKAMRNGDVDEIGDAASPFVNQAAVAARKQFNLIKKEAESVDLFKKQLNASIDTARRAGDEALATRLEEHKRRLNEQGVTVNTAASYLPRVWRVDKIIENESQFLETVATWAMTHFKVGSTEAYKISREIMDEVTRSRPFLDLDEGTSQLDWVSSPSGVKARTFEIPDNLVDDFLENDFEVLMRHHTKTMGMDIELTRKFGDIDMRDTIGQISAEYNRLIKGAEDLATRRKLKKDLERDLTDIRGLRDRLRGTYGASKDPHAVSSRFVRAMKSFNVLVGMGGAVVSSVPDVGRLVMVEGITTAYDKGMRHFIKGQSERAKKLKRRELRQAAIAVDAVLGLRSAAFSDIGDLFGARFGIERKLNQSSNMFFMMNGLNYWNQALKEMAGNMTMLRMTDALTTPWEKLSTSSRNKLLKNGIDQHDHGQMMGLIRQHGEKLDGEWFPNTASWGEGPMRQKFRNALNQNVERMIVTPGAGDRALWTSTEFGSMLTQFKSYGQGAMVRVLTAGLQEKDAAFWQGSLLMVGLGAVVNELKRAQYGIEGEEDYDETLINAIDRSGVLGWFTDVNNAVEKISDFNLGARPALTDRSPFPMPEGAKAGAVLGPSFNNLSNAMNLFGDVITGNVNEKTGQTARFITPGANLPYLDPAFDVIQRGIFGQQDVN